MGQLVEPESPPLSESGLDPEELTRLEILKGVSPASAWGTLMDCPVKSLLAGDWLLTKGQPNRRMYFVLSGRLGIYLGESAGEPVAHLDVGQTVGEMSVIDRSPASAHVIAQQTSRLLEVDDETFWRLINASHQFAVNLLLLLAQRMRANNTNLHRVTLMQREAERDATTDALTGLFNRRWWDEKIERLVSRVHKGRGQLGLLVVDVDHFKRYNDNYGHISGDVVLRTVGKILLGYLRPTDLAARFGGEEFVVALPSTDVVGAIAAGERVRNAFRETRIETPDGVALPKVTVSVGVTVFESGDSVATFFARADAALYRAKSEGRDRVVLELHPDTPKPSQPLAGSLAV